MKNTEVGGYLVKQSRSGYQHLMLDEKDSDCGTKKYLEMTLTDKNKGLFMLRWIQGKDGQLIIISSIPINNITYNTTTTKPSNPVNGDLFICFGISDYHKVLQYTTTNSWNSVDSYVWINSSWIQFTRKSLVIFDGILHDSYSTLQVRKGSGGSSGYWKVTSSVLKLYAPAATESCQLGSFSNKIDTGAWSTCSVKATVRGWNGGWWGFAPAFASVGILSSNYTTGYTKIQRPTTTSNSSVTGIYNIDVSSLTGTYDLVFGIAGSGGSNYTGEFNISSIILT